MKKDQVAISIYGPPGLFACTCGGELSSSFFGGVRLVIKVTTSCVYVNHVDLSSDLIVSAIPKGTALFYRFNHCGILKNLK